MNSRAIEMPAIPPPMMQRSVWTLVDLDSLRGIDWLHRTWAGWAISPEHRSPVSGGVNLLTTRMTIRAESVGGSRLVDWPKPTVSEIE